MKKLLKLIFLVYLLTEPVMGRYKRSTTDKRLASLEYKVEILFEGVASMRAELRTYAINNAKNEQNNLATNCQVNCTLNEDNNKEMEKMLIEVKSLYAGFKDLKKEVNCTLNEDNNKEMEKMLMQAKSLYAGFKDLKKVVKFPMIEYRLEIEDIKETQKALLKTTMDQEKSIQALRDTMNHQLNAMHAEQKNINDDILNKLEAQNSLLQTNEDQQQSIQTLRDTMNHQLNAMHAEQKNINDDILNKLKDLSTEIETTCKCDGKNKDTATNVENELVDIWKGFFDNVMPNQKEDVEGFY